MDDVNHPGHYTSHPSGVECIAITEHMNFNLGNAVKYIWRAGLKSPDPEKDLHKALWYVDRELARLQKLYAKEDNAEKQRAVACSAGDGPRKAP